MRISILFFTLLVALSAVAEESEKKFNASLGLETRFVPAIDGNNYEHYFAHQLGIAYSFGRWWVRGEWSAYDHSSSQGNLSIATERNEWLLWGLYKPKVNSWWTPGIGVGTGFYQDQIQTTLGMQEVNSTSDWHSIYGVEGGLTFYPMNWVSLDFAGRALKVQSSSETHWALLMRAGMSL